MKTYTITKTTRLKIDFKAKDAYELIKLYNEGVVDEVLAEKNDLQHYLITDENGKLVLENTYT